jgi:hypothetical protein
LIRDYAATLATAVKNGFWDLFAYGNSPKVSVLEADSIQQWHDTINSQEFINPLAGKRNFSVNFSIHAPIGISAPAGEGPLAVRSMVRSMFWPLSPPLA